MKKIPKTIYRQEYEELIEKLVKIRHDKGITQRQLADVMKVHLSYIGRIETRERRLDVIELMDILKALKVSKKDALKLIEQLY